METPPFHPGPQIIYESLLYKTPPLDKLFVNWKKRWCVLLRKNPFDPFSVELVYYADPMKQEEKGRVDLTRVVRIHPTLPKSKEQAFAVETKDHKFLLKAADANTKSIWVAKLCEFSGQDQSFHVTVPHQPTTTFAEATLKLSTPGKVSVVGPSSGNPVIEIPFGRIRRMGYQAVYDSDILWFETCQCKHAKEEFYFCVVASGMEVACQIIQEYKLKVENATGAFLILEKAEEGELTYVSRAHYGHNEFPSSLRIRILQSGLGSLSHSWPMMNLSRGRRQSEKPIADLLAAVNSQGRRHTVQPVLGGTKSPSPVPSSHSPTGLTPIHSPTSKSPTHGKRTLDQMGTHRFSPGSRSDNYDSGVKLDEFDVSRHSAPCYISAPQSKSAPNSPYTRKQIKKHPGSMSVDSPTGEAPPLPQRRITLEQFTDKTREEQRSPRRGGQGSNGFPSKDSCLGSSADMVVEEHYSIAGRHGAYDRLEDQKNDRHGKNSTHMPSVPPRSLASLAARHTEGLPL